MDINKNYGDLTAQRLRELREKSGDSHAALAEKFNKKYKGFTYIDKDGKTHEIKLSESALKSFEVGDKPHSKRLAGDGMGIRYLRCLADFYGVSADYLLGFDVPPTPNMDERAVIEYTGLKEDSLTNWRDFIHPAAEFEGLYTYSPIDLVNNLLRDTEFMCLISTFCGSISQIQSSVEFPCIFELSNADRKEVDQIDKQLEKYGRVSTSIVADNRNRSISAAMEMYSKLNNLIKEAYDTATARESEIYAEKIRLARERIKKELATNGINET